MVQKRLCTKTLLILTLSAVVLTAPQSGVAQSSQTQQQAPAPAAQSQSNPASLVQAYWHFLNYQNFLDTQAAALEAQGQDGSAVRNQLQNLMGFSDSDYAVIRASLQRMSLEAKALDMQAVALHITGISSANVAQLYALTAQRDADINAEISFLTLQLPPGSMTTFESFLTQNFARYPSRGQITPASGQAIPKPAQP